LRNNSHLILFFLLSLSSITSNFVNANNASVNIYEHGDCIEGNCQYGKGTLKLPNGSTIKGLFSNGKLKLKSGKKLDNKFVSVVVEANYVTRTGKVTEYVGNVDVETLQPHGEGKYYDKANKVRVTSDFLHGRFTGKATALYEDQRMQFEGSATRGILFSGNVNGKVVVNKSDSPFVRQIRTKGYFEYGRSLKTHTLKFCPKYCSKISPSITIKFDEKGKTKGDTFYGANSVIPKLVKQLNMEHKDFNDASKRITNLLMEGELKSFNDKSFTCDSDCIKTIELDGNITSETFRLYIASSKEGERYSVHVGNNDNVKWGGGDCIIKNGVCYLEFSKNRGFVRPFIRITGQNSSIPYKIRTVLTGGYYNTTGFSSKRSDTRKIANRQSSYISTSDVEDLVEKVMKGRSYTVLWSTRRYIEASGTPIHLADSSFAGDSLKAGNYRLFIWDDSSREICMKWEINSGATKNGLKGVEVMSREKVCNSMKVTRGSLSNIAGKVPSNVIHNTITLTGASGEVILVLIKE